jgi:hypothetical protein
VAFIDWSDAEGMLDLFQEFVRDERSECSGDAERRRFLTRLLDDVMSLQETKTGDALQRLRAIHDSIQEEFSADPATLHLADLIHELEGLA